MTFKDASGTTTTKTVEYAYDGFDRRISTTVTDYVSGVAQTPTTEFYVYDEGAQSRGDVILDFVDLDGPSGSAPVVSKRYLWGQAVDQLFAQEDVAGKLLADSDRYLWLLQDKLGTVRDVLDRSGGIVARVEYNAFGVIQSVTNAAGQTIAFPTRWLYTCQEYDPTTGNIWFSNGAGRGRWYSPTLNRFLQPDELGFAAGDRNLYRYVGNSPTNASDPSGREEEEPWFVQKINKDSRLSERERQALTIGYYASLLRSEREAVAARTIALEKELARLESEKQRLNCAPGTLQANVIAIRSAEIRQELLALDEQQLAIDDDTELLREVYERNGYNEIYFKYLKPRPDFVYADFGHGFDAAIDAAEYKLEERPSGGMPVDSLPGDIVGGILSAGISWLARAGASAAGALAKGAGGAAKNFADDVVTKADDLADEAIESAGKGRSRGSLCPERNRLIETGIPRMDGQWVRRWTRITREDELKMAAEISREHTRLSLASKHMTWDDSRAFVYEGMRQFRTKLREEFLRTRKY